MEEKETMEMSTVPKMFWHGVQTRAGRVICRQKELGIWKQVTWDELGRAAREIGMGLVSLGDEPGEVASILANTRQEWVYADLGALGAAGVVNGIYPTDSQAQVEYLMTDSGSVFVFVEDDEEQRRAVGGVGLTEDNLAGCAAPNPIRRQVLQLFCTALTLALMTSRSLPCAA